VVREKSGSAWRSVRGSGVWRSIKDMLGRRRTILEVLYWARNSCSRYLKHPGISVGFEVVSISGRVERAYSSQNEMIYARVSFSCQAK
jgi:hypothetical protein